jgi:hypothetical protein
VALAKKARSRKASGTRRWTADEVGQFDEMLVDPAWRALGARATEPETAPATEPETAPATEPEAARADHEPAKVRLVAVSEAVRAQPA